jgi:hypothetical protein
MSVLNELIEYKQRDSALGTEYFNSLSALQKGSIYTRTNLCRKFSLPFMC